MLSKDMNFEYTFIDDIEIGDVKIMSAFAADTVVKTEPLQYEIDSHMQVNDNSSDQSSIDQYSNLLEAEGRGSVPGKDNQQYHEQAPYICEYCDMSFAKHGQLQNHRRNHQTEACPVCMKTVIARYMKEHIALSHPEADMLPKYHRHRCNKCPKTFVYKSLLIDHLRNHQTKECPVCKKVVKIRVLNMHIARKHSTDGRSSENRPFECGQCTKSYGSLAHLKDHQRDHQTKKCPVCEGEFLARSLKRHMTRKHPTHSKIMN